MGVAAWVYFGSAYSTGTMARLCTWHATMSAASTDAGARLVMKTVGSIRPGAQHQRSFTSTGWRADMQKLVCAALDAALTDSSRISGLRCTTDPTRRGVAPGKNTLTWSSKVLKMKPSHQPPSCQPSTASPAHDPSSDLSDHLA